MIRKGRVGPGQMIAIDLQEGCFYEDREIKEGLPREYPYEEWSKVNWSRSSDRARKRGCSNRKSLRRRQVAVSPPPEDLELSFHLMVEDGKEAVGSMVMTPAACRSIELVQASLGLFPPEFQPGDKPADRSPARRVRYAPEDRFRRPRHRCSTRTKTRRTVRLEVPVLPSTGNCLYGPPRRPVFRNRLRLSVANRRAQSWPAPGAIDRTPREGRGCSARRL